VASLTVRLTNRLSAQPDAVLRGCRKRGSSGNDPRGRRQQRAAQGPRAATTGLAALVPPGCAGDGRSGTHSTLLGSPARRDTVDPTKRVAP
jgi:hypothetical protein